MNHAKNLSEHSENEQIEEKINLISNINRTEPNRMSNVGQVEVEEKISSQSEIPIQSVEDQSENNETTVNERIRDQDNENQMERDTAEDQGTIEPVNSNLINDTVKYDDDFEPATENIRNYSGDKNNSKMVFGDDDANDNILLEISPTKSHRSLNVEQDKSQANEGNEAIQENDDEKDLIEKKKSSDMIEMEDSEKECLQSEGIIDEKKSSDSKANQAEVENLLVQSRNILQSKDIFMDDSLERHDSLMPIIKSKFSVVPQRPSISYDLGSRLRSVIFSSYFGLDRTDVGPIFGELEEAAPEEEVVFHIEEESKLDREPYYMTYDQMMESIAINRIRNNFLQKKIMLLLKRRKTADLLEQIDPPLQQLLQYNQQLVSYGEMLQIIESQRKNATHEIDELEKRIESKKRLLDEMFAAMQEREAKIGYGLIHSKTGKPIPDKFVEKLLRRQRLQMCEVSTMRLKFIKLKEMIQETVNTIEKLDMIKDTTRRLGDYEQLKTENRSYHDKIEERDEELARLRNKCQTTIQILAHMREKTTAFDYDLNTFRNEYYCLSRDFSQLREMVSNLKNEKSIYRNRVMQLKNNSGLLVEPELLRDMEQTEMELGNVNNQLRNCQEDVKMKKSQIRNIRKNIERLTVQAIGHNKLRKQ